MRWVVGIAVVAVIAAFAYTALEMTGCTSPVERLVRVRVADGATQQPLRNVPVVIFRGPEPEFGADWVPYLGFLTDQQIKEQVDRLDRQESVTDETGTVEFRWRFVGIIGKNVFGTFGGLVSDTWIQVAPPGYSAVVLPLDGQSTHRRDYNDETPIVVTIVLNKPTTDKGSPRQLGR